MSNSIPQFDDDPTCDCNGEENHLTAALELSQRAANHTLKPKSAEAEAGWQEVKKPTTDQIKVVEEDPRRNIGIPTGAASASWFWLYRMAPVPSIARYDLPDTPTVRSGRILHHYFKPSEVSVPSVHLLPGVALLGDGLHVRTTLGA